MPESLTESFCERCGTRYAFKAPTELNPLRKARGLAAGLKNYLMSSDSLGEAVTDAMHDESESLADRQRRAFDQTFTFCMTCRQYACRTCWNPAAGSCLTCAPTADATASEALNPETAWPDQEVSAAARLAELTSPEAAAAGSTPTATPRGRIVEDLVWPDLLPPAEIAPPAAAAERAPVEAPAFERELEPLVAEIDYRASDATEHDGDAREEVAWPESDAVFTADATDGPEAVEAAEEVAPEERVVIAFPDAVAAEIVPDVARQAETAEGPALMPAEVPMAPAEVPTAPAEVPLAPAEVPLAPAEVPLAPAAVREHFPEVPPERIAAVVDTPEAAARRQQLDLLGLGDPGHGPAPVAPPLTQRPLPVLPRVDDPLRWIPQEPTPSRGLAMAGASRDIGAVAAAPVGIQDCSHCGLSLSASARFCRRCGQRQLRSA